MSGHYNTLGSTIETSIATAMVDGMSRIGLSANGGNTNQVQDRYHQLSFQIDPNGETKERSWKKLLQGGGDIVLPPAGVDSSNMTKMNWDMAISGYAYKADSVPYYFALSVLFLYSLIAGIQALYMLFTRRSSDSWDSVEEMIVLWQNSRPAGGNELTNTCGG